MKVSIIIPVVNEERNLGELIPGILQNKHLADIEIIVVDGGSSDASREMANNLGAQIIHSPLKSRAVQMNLGARFATGKILYFIHADTRILPSFFEDIHEMISKKGYRAGCYRYKFDSPKPMLKINSWFTRFNGLLSGGGDQTLFITKQFFQELGGFDENYTIMEDFELVGRIRKQDHFCIIPKNVMVSARKYETNSWLRVQMANFTVLLLFFMKASPNELKAIYQKLLVSR